MNSIPDLSFSSHANIFAAGLSLDVVRQQAPAVFAESPYEEMSPRYTFIPSERVLSGLIAAGFVPVDARQAVTRTASALHARHIVRLRRRLETVQLRDAVPEIVFLNSHDGSSAYQLRVGIFRVVCTNGLVVSRGALPTRLVMHRGDIVDSVVAGALEMAERFTDLAHLVERMEARHLFKDEQIDFASSALALRFAEASECGVNPAQLLTCRRAEDAGDDLWTTLNRVQENLLRGGIGRRTASGRLIRTRRIRSIREDVRINSGLWDLASGLLTA